jgi:hypothetical protein
VAGLNLRGSLGVAGAMPTSSQGSIGGMAYGNDVGLAATGSGSSPNTPGMGSIAVTVVATAALAWLWWTLQP